MKRPAVFMDRDGTINEQMGHINHLSRFVLLPGAPEAVRLLNEAGYLAIVVSNQSGVAQGYAPLELVHEVHGHLESALRGSGAYLDGIFFCPHHPRGSVSGYAIECNCRKPKTGLIDQASRVFEIDMTRSYVVGDRCQDIQMAHRCGLRGILVKTGYGRGEAEYVLPGLPEKPAHIAEDLYGAVCWILEKEKPSAAG
ncbi:MAG: HAD family hydrolase [Thermodesulfobacteriota bacterium]